MTVIGFVGLGNMGTPLAANLVQSGHDLVTHDLAGPGHSPHGARFTDDLRDLARSAEVVVLSLPDGAASEQVMGCIGAAQNRCTRFVVETSTVGLAAAQVLDALCREAGIDLVDAPVSGGAAAARARTLMVMYAGSDAACAGVEGVLCGLSDRRRRVGSKPGLAQAMKLANNFLVATALAATSEAMAFGISAGLDMATMLDVLNTSSGQSAASSDKFVNQVLPGTYASGFLNTLMAKDVSLYLEAIGAHSGPRAIGSAISEIWARFASDEPGVDFTRIYPYLVGM